MEKKLVVRFQKLVGTGFCPPGAFCEALDFEGGEEESLKRRGKLFALISLKGPSGFDATVFGQALFDTLEEEYFAQNLDSPLSALERSAFATHRRLVDMALSAHLGQSVDFDLGLAVLWGRVLYLCRLGSCAFYLLREGKISEVELGEEGRVSCASGFVYDGDTLILGSPDFKTYFPPEEVLKNLTKLEEKMMELSAKATLDAIILKFELTEAPGLEESIKFVSREEKTNFRSPFSLNLANLDLKKLSPARIFGSKTQGHWRSKKGVLAFLGVGLVGILFVVSVFLTLRKQAAAKLLSFSQKTLSEIELDLTAATDLVDLNNSKAQEILEKSLIGIKKLESLGVKDDRTRDFKSQVQNLLVKVSKETLIDNPKLVYDFNLLQKNVQLVNLAGWGQTIYAAETKSGDIFEVKVSAVTEAKKLNNTPLGAVREISVWDKKIFALTETGVVSVSAEDGTVAKDLVKLTDWSSVASFKTYSSNLYFLIPGESRILRALFGESGYSRPGNWLKQDINLEKTVGFALDGLIYLLRSDGKVLKLEGGKPADFNLTGLNKEIVIASGQASLYTASDLTSLYLLDKMGKKIMQFNKDGIYQKTFNFENSLSSLESLYVEPSSLKLYVLSGAKLYEANP